MRCREARKKIAEPSGAVTDREFLDHLRECPTCAALARADAALRRDLSLAAESDLSDNIPFNELKAEVVARVQSSPSHKHEGPGIMSKIVNSIGRRPKFGISVAVVLILIAAATLIPLKLTHTVGYEVAIAGVNRDVALDQYRLQELLDAIGVEHAGFHVDGCEQTCNLTITDLKDKNEVQLIKAAFDQMGNCTIEGINELKGKEKATLLKHVSENAFFGNAIYEIKDSNEVYQLVADKIEFLADSGGNYTIWVAKDCDGDSSIQFDYVIMGDSIDCNNLNIHHQFDAQQDRSSMKDSNVLIDVVCKGRHGFLYYTDQEGNKFTVDLSAPDAAEQLEALGLDTSLAALNEKGGNPEASEDIAFFDSAEKDQSGNLPEGYGLSQNYPNPFNPSTRIDFSIPKSERVTINIININGQKVRTLLDRMMDPGQHSVEWNSRDDNGQQVASGVYLYNIIAGDFSQTRKMSLVK